MLGHQFDPNGLKIKLYIYDDRLYSHWELYPFYYLDWSKSSKPTIKEMLAERNIVTTNNIKEADIAFLSCKSESKLDDIDSNIPIVLVEGRDYVVPYNRTRHILNNYPNAVLWKWGKLYKHEDYLLTEYGYAPNYFAGVWDYENPGRSSARAAVDFNPHQLICAFNLFWHPHFSQHHWKHVDKPIDIAFVGSADKGNCFKRWHRTKCMEAMNKLPGSISKVIIGKREMSYKLYCDILSHAKIAVSPWGNGEICGRDAQGLMQDCEVIRPRTREFAYTWPDVWEESIECEPDWSDLEELVVQTLDNWDEEKIRARGAKWRNLYDDYTPLIDRVSNLIWNLVRGTDAPTFIS